MKSLLLATLLFLSFITAHAQQKRLIKFTHTYTDTAVVYDTTRVLYKAGNITSGSEHDYSTGVLKYDTSYQTKNGKPERMEALTYNAAGQKQTSVVHSKEWWMSAYGPSLKGESVYDAKGRISDEYSYWWNQAATRWDTLEISNYFYTGDNLVEFRLRDASAYRRTLYSYDANNKMLTQTEQEYYGGKWNEYYRYLYSYDAVNTSDTAIVQVWVGGAFKNEQRTIQLFDGAKLLIATEDDYDDTAAVWKPRSLRRCTYDAMDRLMLDSGFVWDAVSGYSYNDRDRYTYNAAGLNDTIMNKHGTTTMKYNTDGWLTDMLSKRWSSTDDEWHYFYSDVPTGISAATNATGIKLYPNPASDKLHLAIDNKDKPCIAAIYSATGQLVRQWPIPAGMAQHAISLQGFENGVYIFSLRDATGAVSTAQFVVQH